MSFHKERSSEARFCLVCLARAVRRSLSRGVRPVPKEGNTFDEAGGVDALSPELPELTEPTLGDAQVRAVEDTHRGSRFGDRIGERDGTPTAATVAGDSGAWIGEANGTSFNC